MPFDEKFLKIMKLMVDQEVNELFDEMDYVMKVTREGIDPNNEIEMEIDRLHEQFYKAAIVREALRRYVVLKEREE